MSSITTGGKTTTYAYDADGIRTTKVVGGVTHEYLTLNGKVVYEKIGTGATAKIMIFTYDAQGRPFAVKYSKNNGESFTNYFYALNLQGDVVKIFRPVSVKDADGNITGYTEKTYATYSYNAWGELIGITDSNGNSILNKQTTSTALANLNPLRYRGYYYDNETGFYYLQSRYYDPANRRFINADVFMSTNITNAVACNMFAYCGNSPVANYDPTGTMMVGQLGGGGKKKDNQKEEIIKPITDRDRRNRKIMVNLLQRFGIEDMIPGFESIVIENGATATYSVEIYDSIYYDPGIDGTQVGVSCAGFIISAITSFKQIVFLNVGGALLSGYGVYCAFNPKEATIIPTDVPITQIHVKVEWTYMGMNGLPHYEIAEYDYFYSRSVSLSGIIYEELYYKTGQYEECLFQ